LVLVIHCQFGGRPLIAAVLNELLAEFARSSDVWFARHEELARWALDADVDEHSYRSRFFEAAAANAPASGRLRGSSQR
jgi:allantoinase